MWILLNTSLFCWLSSKECDQREWVRDIWNVWFDQVFPPTPSESEEEEEEIEYAQDETVSPTREEKEKEKKRYVIIKHQPKCYLFGNIWDSSWI